MDSKMLLIAVAAFAVTATGVHAYGGPKVFSRAGLSPAQVEAFEEARELRKQGDDEAARDVLLAAGVTEETVAALRVAAHATRQDMLAALAANDFAAFRELVTDSPLADIVTTPADFEQFRRAHALRQAGEWTKAEAIFTDLGVTSPHHQTKSRRAHQARPKQRPSRAFFADLSDAQRQALRAAQAANDRALVEAILHEAGGLPEARSLRP